MGGLLVTKNTPADGVIAGMEMCTHAPYKAHIAGYSPGSNVVQHNQVDLDQKAIQDKVGAGKFADAKAIYMSGGVNTANGGYNSMSKGSARTLKGFSTNAKARMMDLPYHLGPYRTYLKFFDYYGDGDYADKWVMAALDGTTYTPTNAGTTHAPGGAFSGMEAVARAEAVQKGTAYQNVWMYAIREFEDAIDDCTTCTADCNEHSTNSGSVHAWDEGVAFYTGSLEGTAYGGSDDGKLLYRLAEKRCANFGTCGASGAGVTGTSKVNTELFKLFANGRDWLQQGRCSSVRPVVDAVVSLMTVPLVQGSLRYAYKNSNAARGASAKNAAEGATFSAAVLPLVHACSPEAATTISANLKFGLYPDGATVDDSRYSNAGAVKAAFEDVYACLGITCDMVGQLVDGGSASEYANIGNCPFQSALMAGYVPGSDVKAHSEIDLDQKAMEAALKAKNYTGATDAYANGGNSVSKGKFRAPACGPVCRLGLAAARGPGRLGCAASGPGRP